MPPIRTALPAIGDAFTGMARKTLGELIAPLRPRIVHFTWSVFGLSGEKENSSWNATPALPGLDTHPSTVWTPSLPPFLTSFCA